MLYLCTHKEQYLLGLKIKIYKMKKSQQEKLYNYMRREGRITAQVARTKFGTKNLRARIYELRANGWNILSEKNMKNPSSVVYRVLKAAN
jgi:hypothetical protein